MFNPAIEDASNKLQISHNCGIGGSICASESSTITHNSVKLRKQADDRDADDGDVINIVSAHRYRRSVITTRLNIA